MGLGRGASVSLLIFKAFCYEAAMLPSLLAHPPAPGSEMLQVPSLLWFLLHLEGELLFIQKVLPQSVMRVKPTSPQMSVSPESLPGLLPAKMGLHRMEVLPVLME